MSIQNFIFIGVLLVAFGFFARSAMRLIGYLKLAQPIEPNGSGWVQRILTTLDRWHRSIEDPAETRLPGPIHAMIFWGFLILLCSQRQR